METKNCTRYQKGKKFLGLCVAEHNPQPLDMFYDVKGMKNGIMQHWKSERCKACLVAIEREKRFQKTGGIRRIPKRPKPLPMTEKNCSKFKKGKCVSIMNPQPIENFRPKNNRVNGSSICRSCEQKYLEDNKEKALKRARMWSRDPKNKQRRRNLSLMKLYGLSLEKFNQMLIEQNYCCGLCGIHESKCKQGLFVDHCHTTGKVRELLCTKCNNGLGMFNDDTSLFDKATIYIKRYANVHQS